MQVSGGRISAVRMVRTILFGARAPFGRSRTLSKTKLIGIHTPTCQMAPGENP